MTGRERVRAALDFSGPDRPPRDLWALPYVSLFRGRELNEILGRYPPDIARPELSPGWSGAGPDLSRAGEYTDEWGSVWRTGEAGVTGEVARPVLAEWSALDHFQPPRELFGGRDWDLVNRTCAREKRFMLSAVCARPFERLQFLRGSENVFLDLAWGDARLLKLLRMVHEFYCREVSDWSRSGVDGIFFMDDWGTNHSLLINPGTWRSVFKPLYREYCEVSRAAGKKVFFHSDGHTEAIFGDLVEIGVDAVNSQLFCMDIEELGRRYGGRVTFWGEMDRQRVLPFGTPAEVRAAVRRVRRALGGRGGGLIAQCEWGKDNPRENIEALFSAWE